MSERSTWNYYASKFPDKSNWFLEILGTRILQHSDCKEQFPKDCCALVIAGFFVEKRKALVSHKFRYTICEVQQEKKLVGHTLLFDPEAKVYIDFTYKQFPSLNNYGENLLVSKQVVPVLIGEKPYFESLGFCFDEKLKLFQNYDKWDIANELDEDMEDYLDTYL